MAIYHMQIKVLSRSKGHSSVAAAAYRAAFLLIDERTGLKHDYRVRRGVVETQIALPDGAAGWARTPQRLWSAAEAAERRKDAAVAREFEVALPHELDDLQRSALVRDLAQRLVTRYGFATQASIHAPTTPGGLNHHVHILATTRRVGPEGLTEKTREFDARPGCTEQVLWVRAMVCDAINLHLMKAGVAARVDHRTLETQAAEAWGRGDAGAGIELSREPTKHVGKEAMAMFRRGFEVEAIEENKAIRLGNQQEALDRLVEWRRATRGADATLPNRVLSSAGENIEIGIPDDEDGRLADLALNATTGDSRADASAALKEAERLWSEPFRAWFDKILVMTARFLKNSAERVRAYHDRPQFLLHLKNLIWRLRQLKKDANEGERRQAALAHAVKAVNQAESALEQFNQDHTRSRLLSKSEWRKRRRAHEFEVKLKRRVYATANRAAATDTLEECEGLAQTSAQELEAWSRMLLKRYPTAQDALDERAVTAASLGMAMPIPRFGGVPHERISPEDPKPVEVDPRSPRPRPFR